tara:strand:+ start:433 stop:612 length:180 start_codon:yes stop_codon:yes gene_type:complete
MSASDNKMITAISKMYPKLNKAQITAFVKKKKKPITIASVTKVKVGIVPVKKKKKKKKT